MEALTALLRRKGEKILQLGSLISCYLFILPVNIEIERNVIEEGIQR